MLNIKKTINFKAIRDKGPKAIDIKEDEVIQIVSSGGKEILCVITQNHLMKLESCYNRVLIQHKLREELDAVEINIDEKMKSMEKKWEKMLKLIKEDEKEFKK